MPADLAGITRIAADEVPAEVAGLAPGAVTDIWSAVERFYGLGLHPVVSLVIRRHGHAILKRSIGRVSDSELASPDTPICLFSASKAITALLMHKLVEQGRLNLDDRVVDYLPEFAPHGKDRVTIRQLLAHRAGIPMITAKQADPRLLYEWDTLIDLLCRAKPFDQRFERQAYHAITGGFIAGEVIRRVARMDLPTALKTWIADPLKCRHLGYGLPASASDLAAPNVFTGPRPGFAFSWIAKRILGAPFDRCVQVSNEPQFRTSVIPAGNVYATADDASRVFQMLLNGGVLDGARIFRPDTIEAAVRPVGRLQWDSTLLIPLRFSAGFMLGEKPFGLYGPDSRHAYGHLGFMNILCWADPQRELSVAFLNTGKSLAPSQLPRLARVLGTIQRVCAPVPSFRPLAA